MFLVNVSLTKYMEFWKQNATYPMKSYVVCGMLGRYYIAFVKIIASSKFHSCGRLSAFKQLEV
jgi:hypothetical protein